MLEFSGKIVIYMLLISSGWDHSQPRPIKINATKKQQIYRNPDVGTNINGKRSQRQVVAPTFLIPKNQEAIDGRVRVTAENLREAEAIRKAIQKTVDDNTFVVDTNQPEFNAPSKPSPTHHSTSHNKHTAKSSPAHHSTKSPRVNHTSKPPTTKHTTKKSSTTHHSTKTSPFHLQTTRAPTHTNENSNPHVPKETTDFDPNSIINGFGQNWLDGWFRHSRNIWTDRELWSEVKKNWFEFLDNSRNFWTEMF